MLRPSSPRCYFSTKSELSNFKGIDGGPIYLAIMGKVFDVTKGVEYYGPGGGYSFFAGIDGTRAFVSGEFTAEGLTDDITGLSQQDYLGLKEWVEFYEKDYKYVGNVEGKFYDADGQPTDYWYEVQQWLIEASQGKADEEQLKVQFPPCNIEYKPETGSRVWCTTSSGGIQRDWIGHPRSFYSLDSKVARCACVNEADLNDARLKEYPNCPPDSTVCKLSD
nr:EOG090X0A5G [Cyclestheria hislopi]